MSEPRRLSPSEELLNFLLTGYSQEIEDDVYLPRYFDYNTTLKALGDQGGVASRIKSLEAQVAQLKKEIEVRRSVYGELFDDWKAAESRLRAAQKLMEEYPCWGDLNTTGYHSDPDFCAECPNTEDVPDLPCWVGKMKATLLGSESCTKMDATGEETV